jgi:hypothetical protein
VISKTAHVKEELVVGKEERERTETVRATARHTEVDVDRSAAGDKPGHPAGATTRGDNPSFREKIADKAHDVKEGVKDAVTPRKKL